MLSGRTAASDSSSGKGRGAEERTETRLHRSWQIYFVSVKNAPCRPRWRARRPIVVFTTKLMKKPLCAMLLRYVSVEIKYQEESPPISLGYRVVIPLGEAVAS